MDELCAKGFTVNNLRGNISRENVVVGSETLDLNENSPQAGQIVRRRYTNIWMKRNGSARKVREMKNDSMADGTIEKEWTEIIEKHRAATTAKPKVEMLALRQARRWAISETRNLREYLTIKGEESYG